MEKTSRCCKLCGRNETQCDWFLMGEFGSVCSICATEIANAVEQQTLQWRVDATVKRLQDALSEDL